MKLFAILAVSSLVSLGFPKEPTIDVSTFVGKVRAAVASLEKTEYQHKTEIDEDAKSYLCDCSGFLGFLLKREFPVAYGSLDGEEAPWRSRPLAVTFHETFVRAGETGAPGWIQIRKLSDVRAGDFISWRKDEVVRGDSTGHVLLVARNFGMDPDGRVRLRVIDSTSRIHSDDTRPEGTDGVGEGTMWFGVDENGAPNAYYVDREAKAGKSTQIAIGRLR